MKRFTFVLSIFYFLLLSCKGTIDPCDIKCDNCSSPKVCIECYEDCYESR